MMLQRFPPDDPREWPNRARSNLCQAREDKPGIYREDLCFQAQQAAEESLKALLLDRGVPFPYTHNLAELMRLLAEQGEDVPEEVREAARLTDYAVEARYPGPAEPVTEGEFKTAVTLAERVLSWVEKRLQGPGEASPA